MAGSMKKAIASIEEKYGKDPSKWLQKVTPERFAPQVSPLLDLSTSTAPEIAIPHENRGTVVFIVEASKNWIKGVNVSPPGISGFVSKEGKASTHLKDQLNLYLDRKYKDMLFYPEDVQHHEESSKTIEYRQ